MRRAPTDAAGWDIAGSVEDTQTGRFTDPNVTNDGLNAEGATTGVNPPLTFSLDHVANAGTTVTLLETLKDEFSFGGFDCTGGGAVNVLPLADPDTDRGGTVVVNPGDSVVCTFVNDPAGIGLTKTASQPTLNPGQQFTYTLTAKNTADVPLHDVTFTDTLDSALTFVSSADGCSAVGQLVTCGPFYVSPDPEFQPGDSKVVTFVVQVGANVPVGTVIPNTGEVSAKPVDGPPVTATAPATVDVIEVSPEVVTVPDSGIGTGTLPFTGSDSSMLLKSALWLLALGGGLLLVARRRRRRAVA